MAAVVGEDPLYARRRIDELTDRRLLSIEERQRDNGTKLDALDAKVDTLSARLTFLAGGLAVLSVIVNFIAPIIVHVLTNNP